MLDWLCLIFHPFLREQQFILRKTAFFLATQCLCKLNFSGLLECLIHYYRFRSIQFSHSVVSDSLRPHGLQHARLPCPSPTPGACIDSCPIESVMPPNHIILCRPLLLLPSVFPSIRVFYYIIIIGISLSLCLSLVTKSCPTLVTPWTVACQAPLSMGFSGQ